MKKLERIGSELVDAGRVLRFSLPLLRSGPILPLKPTSESLNPVAVAEDGDWPWALLDDCRRLFGGEVEPVLVPREPLLMALNQVFDMASASAEVSVPVPLA